jgi:predicted CXXCH cytochrome family protein
MRLTVWAVAGVDTLRFLAGVYAEPTRMRLALRDAECRQCHTPILRASRPNGRAADATSTFAAEAETEGRGGASYHAIREHDTVRTACVRCHTSHTMDSAPANRFISKTTVTPICRECHTEM